MTTKQIFVFGSNLAGRHGAGAALYAYQNHGAEYGVGVGRCNDSYAIPTKDRKIRTMPLDRIEQHINDFRDYANANPELDFFVTRLGCGLAGYADRDIAPMFHDMPHNVILPRAWVAFVHHGPRHRYHDHP